MKGKEQEKEQTKEQVMVIKISPELHKILEERAATWEVSNAQYVRNAILFEAGLAGNAKALRLISGNLTDIFLRSIKKIRGKARKNDVALE